MTSQRWATLFEDVQFDADKLADEYNDNCQWLVALSDWQITVILSLLRYAEWPNRWTLGGHTWDEIEAKISELEYCLMAGCNVSDLITTQRLLIGAITGTSVDLDSELPTTGIVDFSGSGLAAALRHDDKNIAQIVLEGQENPNALTLKEYIDAFEGDDKAQWLFVYNMLTNVADILPTELVDKYVIPDPAQFTFDMLQQFMDAILEVINTAINALNAGAETGALATGAAGAAVSSLDTIFSGVSSGALTLSAIIDMIGLFSGEGADTNPELRTMTRVYNDVFVEGDAINVTCSPDVTVNCGGGGGCGGSFGSPLTGSLVDSDPADPPGTPGIDPPPTGFDSWAEYNTNKCKAANFIVQGSEQTFRLLGSANSFLSAGGIAGAGAAITELLLSAASLAMSAGVLGGAAGVSLLAGGVILTLPGWVVGAIVAAIVAVIVFEVSITLLFVNAADEFHANVEQTVCDLYNAQTVEDAKSVLSTAWGDAIASFAIDPPYDAWEAAIRSMMSTVVGYLITNTLINMLFEKSDLVDKYTDPPVSCDGCGIQQIRILQADGTWETITPTPEQSYTLPVYLDENGYYYSRILTTDFNPCQEMDFTITAYEQGGSHAGSGVWHCNETWDYVNTAFNTLLNFRYNGSVVQSITSATLVTPITLTFHGWITP